MSSNNDNDRSVATGKIYPIDLASPKITIVKSVTNSDVKMAHILPGQPKTTSSGQIITPMGAVGLMRPSTQILSTGVVSQPQMVVSGAPVIQGTQIVSQGSQLLGQTAQIISQPQLMGTSGPLLSPPTQIISQGTQLPAQVSSPNPGTIQTSTSTVSGAQVLNIGGSLVTGTANLVVSSSVRALPSSVRVLPPLSHHNTRPVQLSAVNVNVSNATGVLVSKSVTSHVPRGLAAGASLAVRPVLPGSVNACGWGTPRARLPSSPRPRVPAPASLPHATVLTTSVITAPIRGIAQLPPSPRPLPLLQRNYQPAKITGPGTVAVGNSAPAQYYELPRTHLTTPASVVTINAVSATPPPRSPQPQPQPLTRPTILRKRDSDGSPTKSIGVGPPYEQPGAATSSGPPGPPGPPGWEDVPPGGGGGGAGGGSGGSTTMSAASSPAPDDDADSVDEMSPRKKPRKQILTNSEVRPQDFQTEESPPDSPPVTIKPQKRPQLKCTYVCGWRSTALHFIRPSDVRRREPRSKDIVAIAAQSHVLSSAEGWKVQHITQQMDQLVSLEEDVGSQLEGVLRTLENVSGRAVAALQPHAHTLLELLKGNIQRSKIVCEGVQEARSDILRVFTHRGFVSDILARQADKRSFRKHRSTS